MAQLPSIKSRQIRNRRFSAFIAAAAALVLCLIVPATAASQDQLPEILPINPVPDVELVQYDAFGYLDELRDDAIIVDDGHFPLSTSEAVRFYVEGSSRPVDKSFFNIGDLVGVVYDDFSHAKEIWKLKRVPLED
jgi:hypothetical protein